MSRRDDLCLLRDMLEACRQAVAAVRNRSRADLDLEPVWALGLIKCIEIIGEAAGQLSDELRARSESIPWAQIIGMRNRLVHAYFEVDYDQVWKTVTDDLPALIEQLKRLIETEERRG